VFVTQAEENKVTLTLSTEVDLVLRRGDEEGWFDLYVAGDHHLADDSLAIIYRSEPDAYSSLPWRARVCYGGSSYGSDQPYATLLEAVVDMARESLMLKMAPRYNGVLQQEIPLQE
jgi:hypothetical protein